MCGIFGSWWVERPSDPIKKISNALELLKTRGPDDQGYNEFKLCNGDLVLGHTRLSIIDLTSAGHQPMVSKNGRYTIVFNGEIYNYKELKRELEKLGFAFVTETDTEVLLTAWEYWGEECLTKLKGMFAFVIFDKHLLTLTCIRDAFGIKPFFYSFEGNNFVFASEISAVKVLKTFDVKLNMQRTYDYLVHGDYDSNEQTFFEGVNHLLPSNLLTLNLRTGESKIKSWWKPTIKERLNVSFKDATELVREKFLENIKLHMRSDVPIAAALSGGVDSSAVACAMRYMEPDAEINTFSYIAQGSHVNEEQWVDVVNKKIRAKSHKITVNADDLIKDIDELIRAQGEPFGSTSIYAQYRVFKCAKEKGITVTLEGQGADELLAGYHGYPGSRLRSLIEQGAFVEAYQFLQNWSEWPGRSKSIALKILVSELMPQSFQNSLRNLNGMPVKPNWLNVTKFEEDGVIFQHPKQKREITMRGRRVIAELANALNKKGLPHLLRHGDRNSMALSIESRVPFLTIDYADLLLSLPEDYLISKEGETKHIFRAAMKGIVPDEILYRRDKVGFETPELKWFQQMRSELRSWLTNDIELPFINQKNLLDEFDAILDGHKSFSWQVWRWLNFYRWYKLNFD